MKLKNCINLILIPLHILYRWEFNCKTSFGYLSFFHNVNCLKLYFYALLIYLFLLPAYSVYADETVVGKRENILDFSAGIIEGEINRPSILMELGTNFNTFNDLVLLREDFNSFHEVDSIVRLRYMEEGK